MKAVVMAGGEGTRLRPLTSNQPKPLVPIVGKPCMAHIVELLKKHGFEDVIVTVAFLPQAIRSYFGTGESLGVDLAYSVEESPAGTAGSAVNFVLMCSSASTTVSRRSSSSPSRISSSRASRAWAILARIGWAAGSRCSLGKSVNPVQVITPLTKASSKLNRVFP